MLIAAILAGLALVAGCCALHLTLWLVAAFADRHREQLRRGPRADISHLH